MAIKIEKIIVCDGEGCKADFGRGSGLYDKGVLRKSAALGGWANMRGGDYCPVCKKKKEYKGGEVVEIF